MRSTRSLYSSIVNTLNPTLNSSTARTHMRFGQMPVNDMLTDRTNRLRESATFKAAALAASLPKAINLTTGELAESLPEPVANALIAGVKDPKTAKYAPAAGLLALREKIAAHYNIRFAAHPHTANAYATGNVIISVGGKGILELATRSLIQAGRSVAIETPCWVSYEAMAGLQDGHAIFTDGSPEQLEEAIQHGATVVIFNYPGNPGGRIPSREEMLQKAEILSRYQYVTILSDDIYESIVYDNKTLTHLLDVAPGLKNRTLIATGDSKAKANTGGRAGVGVGPAWLINAMIKLQGNVHSGTPHLTQVGMLAAVGLPFPAEWLNSLHHKRNIVVHGLNKAGIPCEHPDGAFYAFPNVSGLKRALGVTVEELAGRLASAGDNGSEGVVGVAGTDFQAPDHMRFSFPGSTENLTEAMRRIGVFARKALNGSSDHSLHTVSITPQTPGC